MSHLCRFAALLLLALSPSAHAAEPDARELARALSPERLGLAGGEATIAMELRDKAGRIVTRTMRARSASNASGKKMRLTFLAPSDQRGVELLVIAPRGEAPLQYLWLPRSAELRRIASSERGGRFQGSDFAFADFEDRDLSAAEIRIAGDEPISGLAAWRIEITARAGTSPVWSRVVAWIAKEARVPLEVEFYRGEVLQRRLEVTRLQPLDGRLVPTRLVMSDLVRGTRTTLVISELAPSATFPDAIFTPEALGR